MLSLIFLMAVLVTQQCIMGKNELMSCLLLLCFAFIPLWLINSWHQVPFFTMNWRRGSCSGFEKYLHIHITSWLTLPVCFMMVFWLNPFISHLAFAACELRWLLIQKWSGNLRMRYNTAFIELLNYLSIRSKWKYAYIEQISCNICRVSKCHKMNVILVITEPIQMCINA